MMTFPKSLLPLLLVLPAAAQQAPMLPDAETLVFPVRTQPAIGLVLVAPAPVFAPALPGLPALLVAAEPVLVVSLEDPDLLVPLPLPRLPGLCYAAQAVVVELAPLQVFAAAPVLVDPVEEPADPAAQALAEPSPYGFAAVEEPLQEKPMLPATDAPRPIVAREDWPLKALAEGMEFWHGPLQVTEAGDEFRTLEAEFTTARSGFAWADRSKVRATSDGTEVWLFLQLPVAASGHLLVEAHHRTSVRIEAGLPVKVFVALLDGSGRIVESGLVRELPAL